MSFTPSQDPASQDPASQDPASHAPALPAGALPAWASVFNDPAEANAFAAVVADVIEQRWGSAAEFDAIAGSVTLPSGSILNIANTARELVSFDEPYRRSYLYLMLSANEAFDPSELQAEMRSWSRIRSRLRIRLHPAGPLTMVEQTEPVPLVERPLSDSVSFVLAADTDIGSVAITTEVAAAWGKPIEQAWRAAIKNTKNRSKTRGALVQTPMTSFLMIEGDLFTTGYARDLRSFRAVDPTIPSPVGAHGSLVMAPTSRTLFVKPIDDPRSLASDVVGLVSAAAQFQSIEPNPLSLDVFWYRGVDDLVGAIEIGPTGTVHSIAPSPFDQWLAAS